MTQKHKIQIFEDKKVRTAWDDELEEWFFSVVDVCGVLTEQKTARGASTYWAVLKTRLSEEGADEVITNCKQLKMRATDGRMRFTDAADAKTIFRIIQSIPSKKAEPFKRWMAEVAAPARALLACYRRDARIGSSHLLNPILNFKDY